MESAYCDNCGENEVHYQDDYGQVALVLCAECNGGHATAGGHNGAVPTAEEEENALFEQHHQSELRCYEELAEKLGEDHPDVQQLGGFLGLL
jgi:hypothetical protein